MLIFFKKIKLFFSFEKKNISKRKILNYICLIDNFRLPKHYVSKAYKAYLINKSLSLPEIRNLIIQELGIEKFLFLKIKSFYFKKYHKEISGADIISIKSYLKDLNFSDEVFLFDAEIHLNKIFN